MFSAQTEYLLALNQASGTPGAESLKTSALTKLKFFDVSDEQIAELEKTRKAAKTLRVNAPRDGIVVEKMAIQGQMVEAGMKLYRLADLAIVWVQSQIYEQDLAYQPGKCPKCEMELVPTGTVSHGKQAEEQWRKQHPSKLLPPTHTRDIRTDQ